MKQFEVQEFGIDKLALVDCETPKPAHGEVLVRLRAASLNFRDLMVTKGSYNPKMHRPMVPLSDGCGVVEEIGPGVTRVKKGERVAAGFMQRWLDGPPTKEKGQSALGGAIDGVLREYAVFAEDGLVKAPDFLSDEEVATLPCAAVTAWHALFEDAAPKPGDSVLLQGTGGVSIFALQFASAAGLRAIVTSSSEEKIARALQLGATATINYQTNPDWDKAARAFTNGEGVGHVVEVGGSGTMERSLRAVRVGGMISVIGALSGASPSIDPRPVLMNSIRLQGVYVGSRAMFERMLQFLELKQIKPVIDRVFPWLEAKEAMQYMESQRHLGKICLKFD